MLHGLTQLGLSLLNLLKENHELLADKNGPAVQKLRAFLSEDAGQRLGQRGLPRTSAFSP